jgi:predicted dehydrogenase
MGEFVRLLGERRIEVADLVTHTFPIEEAIRAFELVTSSDERSIAVLIEYPAANTEPRLVRREPGTPERRGFAPSERGRVGFVGAGSFARRHLIPLARRNGLVLERVATASGLSAVSVAQEFGFVRGACSVDEIVDDDEIEAVIVASRHDAHARTTRDALRAGKAVFCEKPLCLTAEELDELRDELARDDAPPLMVGFNRRFAPLTMAAMEHLATATGPTNVLVRVNAGRLPAEHWLNDPEIGGGRLLGEGCHFVDLITYLVGTQACAVAAHAQRRSDEPLQSAQEFVVSIRFADGSLGTLAYGSRGAPTVGKELIEVHRGDRSARIEDFKSLRLWGAGRARTKRSRRQDKGHSDEMRLFADTVRGRAAAPPAAGYLTSTALTFAALRSLETGRELVLDGDEPPATSLEET